MKDKYISLDSFILDMDQDLTKKFDNLTHAHIEMQWKWVLKYILKSSPTSKIKKANLTYVSFTADIFQVVNIKPTSYLLPLF